MNICIALLRGINVGGHKPVKMAELKRMFEDMGFGRVQTFIQSGNVLFESEESAERLGKRIERQIEEVFGYQVPVVIRTSDEWERLMLNCPFDAESLAEGESLYVALLAGTPSQQGVDRLLACSSDIDDYRFRDREVYILCRQSIRKSMFSNNLLEKKLGVPATSRNWQTMYKLAAMCRDMAD